MKLVYYLARKPRVAAKRFADPVKVNLFQFSTAQILQVQ